MAYGLRFRGEWLDKLGGLSRFDIEERDFLGNAEIMDMQEDPLDTERANIGDKTSVGSGCELRVTATYDGQYLGLYTKDAQKYKAKHYKDGRLIWVGYLNTEVYSEGYDRVRDYPVTLQFNDGMAVLERIKFLKSNGERYTELMTSWDVIAYIIDRLGLEFQYLYTAFDIYEKNMDTAKELLQQKKVDTRNYYDEKGEPLNCREVLEAIISPFNAVCFTHEACLIIIRWPLLSRANYTRKRYALGSSIGIDQVVNPCLSIPSQVDFYEMDQQIDMVAGKNKAVLKYSPYGIEDILEGIDIDDQANWIGTGEWTSAGNYFKLTGVTAQGWTLTNGAVLSGSKEEELDSDEEIFFSVPYSGTEQKLIETNLGDDIRITAVEGQSLRLKFKMYIRTKDNEYDSEEEAAKLHRMSFKHVVEIAGERPVRNGATLSWSVNNNYVSPDISNVNTSITDSWQEFEYLLPVGFKTGAIKWILAGEFKALDYWDTDKTVNVDIKEIRIKDVGFELVNLTEYTNERGTGYLQENASFDDIEFTGEMDDQWINEAPDIEMIHGDSKHNNCTDRGGFHLLDDEFTSEWKTSIDTQYYGLEPLLLRSFISNYQDSKFKLTGTLEAPNLLNGNGLNIDGILSFHSVLTYPGSTMGNRKLMFMGGTYNDKRQTISGEWVEILDDDLTINEQ